MGMVGLIDEFFNEKLIIGLNQMTFYILVNNIYISVKKLNLVANLSFNVANCFVGGIY